MCTDSKHSRQELVHSQKPQEHEHSSKSQEQEQSQLKIQSAQSALKEPRQLVRRSSQRLEVQCGPVPSSQPTTVEPHQLVRRVSQGQHKPLVLHPHQPDLVTNSISSSARDQRHLANRCLTMSARLRAMRKEIRQRTTGFEAMLVLVRHLSQQVHVLK